MFGGGELCTMHVGSDVDEECGGTGGMDNIIQGILPLHAPACGDCTRAVQRGGGLIRRQGVPAPLVEKVGDSGGNLGQEDTQVHAGQPRGGGAGG